MRIREVVKESGVSRELIHHYLRHGLLPQPEERAQYSSQHVQLLRLLKKMREDHHLPLDVIRNVFEIFDFDPAHLEPFTLADSLNNRLINLTNGGDILSETLPSSEIVSYLGISPDRLREYVQAKLVRSVRRDDEERFSIYDMNIIAICERGTQLGIPFDSLRNISAYVRVAFELEHKFLFEVARQAFRERRELLGEIFVRQEIITSFIQNLVQSMICQRLMDLISLGREVSGTMENILFRPSTAFWNRHGLDRALETVQESLSLSPDEPDRWGRAARLMLHAGRFREACFFLEQALDKWPSNPWLQTLHGKALLLSGHHRRAIETLKQQASSDNPDPLALVFLVLCLLNEAGEAGEGAPLMSHGFEMLDLVEQALESVEDAGWETRTEVRMIGGWALSSIPSSLTRADEGMSLLTETLHTLKGEAGSETTIPGLRERYLINTAYLLFRCRSVVGAPKGDASLAGPIPSTEELRNLICSLDPASLFAEKAFLETSDPVAGRGENP